MKISFANPGLPTAGIVCVGVMADRKLTDSAKALDKQLGGGVSRAVKVGQFEGKRGQSVCIPAPGGSKLDAVLIVGMGEAKSLDALACQGRSRTLCFSSSEFS